MAGRSLHATHLSPGSRPSKPHILFCVMNFFPLGEALGFDQTRTCVANHCILVKRYRSGQLVQAPLNSAHLMSLRAEWVTRGLGYQPLWRRPLCKISLSGDTSGTPLTWASVLTQCLPCRRHSHLQARRAQLGGTLPALLSPAPHRPTGQHLRPHTTGVSKKYGFLLFWM